MAHIQNTELSQIMNRAWSMHRTTSVSMKKALKDAWELWRLQRAMRLGRIELVYRKKDGSIRRALATLVQNSGMQTVASSHHNTSPKVFTYFDIEVNDWRCFKCENLMSWQIAQ